MPEIKLEMIGQMDNSIDHTHESANRVYSSNGLAPTLNTCGGGGLQPKIVAMRGRDENQPTSRKRQTPDNKFKQRLEVQDEDVSNTLTTFQKDNLVLEPQVVQRVGDRDKENYSVKEIANCIPANPMSDREQMLVEPITTGGERREVANTILARYERSNMTGFNNDNAVLIKQATKQGYIECEVGGVADLSYPDSKLRRGRVQEGGTVCPTIIASNSDICRIEPVLLGGLGEKKSNGGTQYYQQDRVYDTNGVAMAHPAQIPEGSYKYMTEEKKEENMHYRIRKLTPKECFRLMGVRDEDYDKLTVSNSQRYKQAGNSIVVDVLEAIFENMFINECESNSLF